MFPFLCNLQSNCPSVFLIKAQWRHVAPEILANTCWCNSLLPDGSKPSLEQLHC